MKGRAVVVVGLVLAGCLLYQGCESTVRDPVTGAEAQYRWETLEARVEEGIAVVYEAARETVDRLDLRVLRDELDGIAAEILALDAHFDSVEIRLEALPESGTLLMIRVGLFGDRNKSAVLFGRIMETLGQSESVASAQGLQMATLGRGTSVTGARDLFTESLRRNESTTSGRDLQWDDRPRDFYRHTKIVYWSPLCPRQ